MKLFSRLLRSFACAGAGIAQTLRTERNLRIHVAAACYAVWAGFLAGLDGPRWSAVLLCCGAVMAAELFNTAMERLCDAVCPQRNAAIGAAKDAAAGAVLVLALISLGVAAAVFGPWVADGGLIRAMERAPWIPAAFTLSLAPAILWVRGWWCGASANR